MSDQSPLSDSGVPEQACGRVEADAAPAMTMDRPAWRFHEGLPGASPTYRQVPHTGSHAAAAVPTRLGRVRVDGKRFAADGRRFPFHGVTYGTFRPRDDSGARFPPPAQVRSDFAAMHAAGFTVVRTYTPPTDDMLEFATEFELRLLAGVFYLDWRYLVGRSRSDLRRTVREARAEVSTVARRLAGEPVVLGLCLGNEIPADVIRWVGTGRAAALIAELADVVRDQDPGQLVTYANYPTAEYLPLESLDFLTFNVFLEQRADFRRYLTRLHHLAGDRPLVLGEMGLDAGPDAAGEAVQARVIDWQLATALERGVAGACLFSWTDEWFVGDSAVEGWHFGLTRRDRSPRPALATAQRWSQRTVADVHVEWPPMSVVVCAYNAAATLDECLTHTCALDYPDLEIIVVDDGSTDATAAIAGRHPRARLLRIPHGGLAVARNEGFRAAAGQLIAYLDSDAYPAPEWPYYLALGMDGDNVGGTGGPNVPPREDPVGAQLVAHCPGGPVHVLITDDRAEHVPGCNMAFWKTLLEEVGGFDPIYTSAGDDVDICWKVLDRGVDIGFHPAALVWHHRRSGVRAYLRQQRGYGRAEALVEARHPHRFTASGSARWRGRIYDSFAPRLVRQRVYRGMYGTANYQSVYRGGGHFVDLAHQVGIPLATLILPTGALALRWPPLGIPALAGLALLLVLWAADAMRLRPPRGVRRRLRFRCVAASLHLVQPLVRVWARSRHRALAREGIMVEQLLTGPLTRPGRGVLLLPEDRPRHELVTSVVAAMRRTGLRVLPASGWEDYDVRLVGSTLVYGDVITSSHPVGFVQLRVRRRCRRGRVSAYAAALLACALLSPLLAGALLVAGVADAIRGIWRTGPGVRRAVGGAVH